MNAEALDSLLPVAPRPAAEERLSSWLSRIAEIYGLSANALLVHFGLAGFSALTLEQGLSAGQGASIATRAGLSAQTIGGMTFSALAPQARFMIAPSARYFRPSCAKTPAIGRKDVALPWTFWCSVHGVRLWAREKRPMESFLPESALERLDPLARRGAARFAAWAEDRDPKGETGAPTVTRRYRRRLAAAELRIGGRRGAVDRKPRRVRSGGAVGGRRRGGDEPAPNYGDLALCDASAHRRRVAAPHGRQASQKCAAARSIAAQFHKLCASPTNFGAFRSMNRESKFRNYAPLRRAARRIPQIMAFRHL